MKLLTRVLLAICLVVLMGIGFAVYAPHALALTPTLLAPSQTVSPPSADAPATVPPEFYAALLGFVAFLVTQGLKSLSEFLAKHPGLAWMDISGFGSVLTAFIVTGLMFYINMGLGLMPGAFAPTVPLLFQFLIGLFAAYGSHLTVKTVGGG